MLKTRLAVIAIAAALVSCSDGSDLKSPSVSPSTLEGPITVGTITPPLDPRSVDLEPVGYVEEEWFASGTAESYASVGEISEDGHWRVEVNGSAPYMTRIVVRRPANPGGIL